MTTLHELQVYENRSNGQKLVTIPAGSDIKPGETVLVGRLGAGPGDNYSWGDLPAKLRVDDRLELMTAQLSDVDEEIVDAYKHREDPRDIDIRDGIHDLATTLDEMRQTMDDDLGIIEDADYSAYTVLFGPVNVPVNARSEKHAIKVAEEKLEENAVALEPGATEAADVNELHPDDGR